MVRRSLMAAALCGMCFGGFADHGFCGEPAPPGANLKRQPAVAEKRQITAQMLIMDVPDLHIDFQSAPEDSAEEPKSYLVLSPTAAQALQKKLAGDCKILARPQARGLLNNPMALHIGSNEDSVKIRMLGKVSKAAGELDLTIDAKNRRRLTHVNATVPLGQTLVVNLGTHVVQAASMTKVPILGDLPLISRYFTSMAVAREKRQTLVFITPEFVKE